MMTLHDSCLRVWRCHVGVLDFGSCVEKIMSSWAERQVIYQWSHYEAVLFCLNILNR